jgi:hypothetical protein
MLPGVAFAQEPPPPQPLQELFLTEVVYPQERGEVQVTLASLVDRSAPGAAALTPVSIEYGVTNRWQVEASWNGYRRNASLLTRYRTESVSVGTKYSFMNIAHSHVHAAMGLDADFHPMAVDDIEDETGTEIEPFVSLAVDLPRRVTLFGSVGKGLGSSEVAALFRHGEAPTQPATISVGGLIAFRHVTLTTEYTDRSDALPWRVDGAPLLTPGVVLHPGGDWEVGLGTPIGMRTGEHAVGFAVHILKEFGGR